MLLHIYSLSSLYCQLTVTNDPVQVFCFEKKKLSLAQRKLKIIGHKHPNPLL